MGAEVTKLLGSDTKDNAENLLARGKQRANNILNKVLDRPAQFNGGDAAAAVGGAHIARSLIKGGITGGSIHRVGAVRGGSADMDEVAVQDPQVNTEDGTDYSSTIGGYDDLQKYGDSVYSRGKERLIRSIAKDIFDVLKIRGADAQTSPIEKVVNTLRTVIPNPKRKGNHFNDNLNKSSSKQSAVCKALANVINKHYGGQIVPTNASEHEICVKISEVMTSLFTGLHTEFMVVAGDMMRIVRNLTTLREIIDASYKRQVELTNASGDPQLKMQAANVQEFYNRIRAELDRQLAILTNLVNVSVGPTGKSLIGLLEDNRDFAGLVQDLKADLGTSAFGDKLAYLLSGVSNVAHSAELIDKALKVLGMSVRDFRAVDNLSDLRLKILDHIEKKSPTSKELDKMMAAAEIIYKNDYDHAKISKLLEKKGGDCGCDGGNDGSVFNMPNYVLPGVDDTVVGVNGVEGGRKKRVRKLEPSGGNWESRLLGHDDDDVDRRIDGGDSDANSDVEDNNSSTGLLQSEENSSPVNIDDKMDGDHSDEDADVVMGGNIIGGDDENDTGLVSYWARKSLSNKLDKKKKYRDLLLKDFRKVLRLHYRTIINAADKVAKRIGSEIPASEDLYRFVDVFQGIPGIDSDDIHIALSGYPKDSVSRQERDNFMNRYHLLLVALEPLAHGPGGVYFKDIHRAVEDLVKAIDNFSDKMVKAITEIHIDRPEDIRNALQQTATHFFGAGASGAGGDDMFGKGSFVDLDKIKMELKYFLSIYNIKTNLSRVSEEMKAFGEDYEQVLGEEAGWLINQIKKDYLDLIDSVNPVADPSRPAIAANVSMGTQATAAGAVGPVGQLINARAAAAATPQAPAEAIANNMFNQIKELYTRQMNAKVKMVEVAQAVDLYLRAFADGIARNPDSIKNVVKMLDQVEIVAKWFSDRSGDQLASLFEVFPNRVDRAEYSTDAAPRVPGAANSQDAIISGKPDGKTNLPMVEAKQHYYQWIDKDRARGDENRYPGNPTIGRPLDENKDDTARVKNLLGLSERTIKSMRALENILSAFATVGSKFGDDEPLSKTFMTPGQMFNAICDYVNVSAFTTGYRLDDAMLNAPVMSPYPVQTLGGAVPLVDTNVRRRNETNTRDNTNYASGLTKIPGNNNITGDPIANTQDIYGVLSGVLNANQKNLSVAMATIPVTSRLTATAEEQSNGYWNYHDASRRNVLHKDYAGWTDRFYDTDLLFEMTIKSIVCKVLTVVDAYRLFNRPLSALNSDQYDSLTPLRTILGGSSHVKVLPEALELYLRLPLLAEWYRDKLSFEPTEPRVGVPAPPNDWVLALVPTVDGIWSKFILMMFDKTNNVPEGNYSEPQMQRMINEMNEIYRHYKSKYPKATVRNIINSFVIEVNRAYGFIRQEEITKYLASRRAQLEGRGYTENKNDNDFNNYDILNADDQFGRSPAPSDKFVTVAERQKKRRERSMVHLQKDILDLRRKMDMDFRRYTNQARQLGQTVPNFVDMLNNYKKEVHNAKSEKEQYDIVLRLMQGTSTPSNVNVDKVLMLHEAVAAPLAVLYNVYKVMAKYNALLHGTAVKTLRGFVNTQVNGGNHNTAIYATHLHTVYPDDTVNNWFNCNMFARVARGTQAALTAGGIQPYLGNHGAGAGTVNNVTICRDTIAAILDLCSQSNGLVRCSVSLEGNINVDWSPLEEMSCNLLQQVKNNLNNLRIEFVNTDTNINEMWIDRYSNKANIGSVNWLEEHLVEQLFKSRDRCGLMQAHTNHLKFTLEVLCKTDGAVWAPGGDVNLRTGDSMEDALSQLIYYSTRLNAPNVSVTNNLTTFPFNILPLRSEVDMLDAAQKTFLNNLRQGAAPNAGYEILQVPAILFDSADSLNLWNLRNSNNNRSLFWTFNKALHLYLYDNLDDGTQKIYPALFESFMNSVASKEVIQSDSFPNVAQAPGGVNATLQSPHEDALVFASTAATMRALMTNMDKLLKKRRNAFDSLAEVPDYLKERMKCNLPLYSKIFQMIFNRADLMRKFINNVNLKNNVATPAAAQNNLNAVRSNVVSKRDLKDMAGKSSAEFATYLDQLLSHLSDLSFGIKKCCDAVYKELQDVTPYFMDLAKDFISDYKTRYGVLPFMPASNVLLPQLAFNGNYVRNRDEWLRSDLRTLLLPNKYNGSNAYRFNLSSRVLLARNDVEPQLDHMPGAKELYNLYASVAQKHSMVSANEYTNTLKLMINLSRFLNDGAVYSRLFAKHDPVNNDDAWTVRYNTNSVFGNVYSLANGRIMGGAPTANNVVPSNVCLVDAFTQSLGADSYADNNLARNIEPICVQFTTVQMNSIINFIDNSNKKQSKEMFARVIRTQQPGGLQLTGSRENMRTYNILDMGIVPINVHAFMKEVPFTNILNYSYTFDRMAHDLVAPNYVRALTLSDDNSRSLFMIPTMGDINTTRELLVKLLVHPYSPLGSTHQSLMNQYYGLVASLFNGNDDLKLGRPRYLSDQLWHKVLLSSSPQYAEGTYGDANRRFRPNYPALESGPAGYEAQRALLNVQQNRLNNTVGDPTRRVIPVFPNLTEGLKYWNKNPAAGRIQTWVVKNTVPLAANSNMAPEDVLYCAELGHLRFNTKLVRNLTWFVNLQRVMRVMLINHLSWLDTPVITGLKIADPVVTEYNANDQYKVSDFQGTDYSAI